MGMIEIWECPVCGCSHAALPPSEWASDCCRKKYAWQRVQDLGREMLNRYWQQHGCEGTEELKEECRKILRETEGN